MKRIILFLLIIISIQTYGQEQIKGFSYQAVVRSDDGLAIANTDLNIIVELYERDENRPVYSEEHQITTDDFGQLNLIIGNGEGDSESFKAVPWSTGAIFYKIHIINHEEGLNIMSEAQILAVPYAFHSQTTNEVVGNDGASNNRMDIIDGKLWTVEGNNIQRGINKLGTLSIDDLNIITSDLTRIRVDAGGQVNILSEVVMNENLILDGYATINGGANIALDVNIGADLTVDKNTLIKENLDVLRNTNLNGNLYVDKDFLSNGKVTLDGGLLVAKMSPTHLTGTLRVDKDADFNSKVDVDGETTLNNTLDVDGNTTLNSELDVDGATTLNDILDVDGATTLNALLDVDGTTHLHNTLEVDGTTKLNSAATIEGATIINNTLQVKDASTFNDKISVTHDVNDGEYVATFENTNAGNGDGIKIKLGKNRTNLAPPSIPALMSLAELNQIRNLIKCNTPGKINILGNIVLEGLQADIQMIAGLAIGTGNILLNFINTNLGLPYDIPKGFIVNGYRLLHIGMPAGIPDVNVHLPDLPPVSVPLLPSLPNINLSGLGIPEIPIYDLNFWGIPNLCLTDSPGSTPLNNENEFITFSDKSDVKMGAIRAASVSDWADNYLTVSYLFKLRGAITSAVDKKHARYHFKGLVTDAVQDYIKIGVEYSSGNGDYAEWIERSDLSETINPGDIVGISGAKVTKDLTSAEQVMVVSHNPIVLGNVPASGETFRGNNIAFMGQVPVKVMGPVKSGDYILGSPNTPGYGIAKSHTDMTAEDFKYAVGRSWETTDVDGPILVNTVVGIHNGDYSRIFNKINSQIQQNDIRLNTIEARLNNMSSQLSNTIQSN